MSRPIALKICGVMIGIAAACSGLGILAGQEPKDPSFRGRLPAYYGEIVTEAQIHPPNVAPWRWTEEVESALHDAAITAGADDSKNARPLASRPTSSARPSGLEPGAIGAARAKIANGTSHPAA